MAEIVYCKDCKHSRCWRTGELADKFGKAMECSLQIIWCPNDYDFCSKGEKLIRCKQCGLRFDNYIPNYCPNCGAKMAKSQESEDKCSNCAKSWTDDCPREKCWDNDYSEFIEESER